MPTSHKSHISALWVTALVSLAGLVLFSLDAATARMQTSQLIPIGQFSLMKLDNWKARQFDGDTDYQIVEDRQGYHLRAISHQSASALYYQKEVDLRKTPYLNWRWQIDQPLQSLPEQEKRGDDYAARIYVVVKTGKLPWSLRAINYVWSSSQMPDSSWPNAFTSKAVMVAVRSNLTDPTGIWLSEKVNVRENLQKHLGLDGNVIHGVAIMTDTDNSSGTAGARYGDIYFSSE